MPVIGARDGDGWVPGRPTDGRVDHDGHTQEFTATVRIDTPAEAAYYRRGGILQYVLRQLLDHDAPAG
jgi:aconitate hydratase